MRKNAKINFPPISRLKISFSNFSGGINTNIDENLLPINYAKMSYNTDFKDHALKTGRGFKRLELPKLTEIGNRMLVYSEKYGNIDGFWVFKRYSENEKRDVDLVFVHADDNQIYYQGLYSDFDNFKKFINCEYKGKPNVLFYNYNGQDVAVLSSKDDYLAIWNGKGAPAKVANTLSLTSICVHYERIFATVSGRKNLVRFSDNFNIAEWDETPQTGGFIAFSDERGDCNKVISFNDYVYVIREHGISRLSAYAEQSNFAVAHLFLCTDKIYDNTAVLCGDRIIMVCSDGLYCFNGYSVTKYNLKINKMFVREKLDNAVACYFDGKYYLACCLDFMDDDKIGVEQNGYKNNALLEFDIKSGQYIITRGVDIRHLTPIVDGVVHKLAVIFNSEGERKIIGELTNDGTFFGVPMKKSWVSPLSDFGYPDKIKVIREVHLFSKFDITLIVQSENEKRVMELKGSRDIIKICPNIKGKQISLSFVSENENFSVSNPNVVVDLL